MYEIVLNYKYLDGNWKKVMIIYLVWNIDGDEKYKIIINDRKGDGNKYVEIFFIEKIKELILELKNGKGIGGQKWLCIMVYINNFFCFYCIKKLIVFLNENKWVCVNFYVINLYNIYCKFCRFREEFYFIKVDKDDYKKNFKGLKKFMQYDSCEIMVFIKDVWKMLIDIVIVLSMCKI